MEIRVEKGRPEKFPVSFFFSLRSSPGATEGRSRAWTWSEGLSNSDNREISKESIRVPPPSHSGRSSRSESASDRPG